MNRYIFLRILSGAQPSLGLDLGLIYGDMRGAIL